MSRHPAAPPGAGGPRLRVDPIACQGIAICAHLAPDLIRLDSWGFPITAVHGLSQREERKAGRAVAGCPRHALFLQPDG
jgi:ferredoxin